MAPGTGRTPKRARDIPWRRRCSTSTQTGYEKLKATITELETVKRREVAERIKAAREFGDISENSEYDDAKNEQALLETRILRPSRSSCAAPV